MTTPLYDELVKIHPYPSLAVDTTFQWDSTPPRPAAVPPRVGARPVNKRKKKR